LNKIKAAFAACRRVAIEWRDRMPTKWEAPVPSAGSKEGKEDDALADGAATSAVAAAAAAAESEKAQAVRLPSDRRIASSARPPPPPPPMPEASSHIATLTRRHRCRR